MILLSLDPRSLGGTFVFDLDVGHLLVVVRLLVQLQEVQVNRLVSIGFIEDQRGDCVLF